MISVTERLPDCGKPVVGFSPKWIDPRWNPLGMRECFRSPAGVWVSAVYTLDTYCTHVDPEGPTHWEPFPQPPEPKSN